MGKEYREYSQKYLQIKRGQSIVYEAREVPFFNVNPELSDLGENQSLRIDLGLQYPKLFFQKACLVDGAVLIQDLSPFVPSDSAENKRLLEIAKGLNKFSSITLQVVDGNVLTRDLIELIKSLALNNPLLIFPGEGAKVVEQYLSKTFPNLGNENKIFLPTSRVRVRPGKFDLSVDFSPLPQAVDTRTIVIVDDVIATGQTVETIASSLREKYGDVKIIVATWAYLNRPSKKQSRSGVENVSITVASTALKGNNLANPPINSLSCFLRSGDKYEEVKSDFVRRYIKNPTAFAQSIQELKGLV